MEEVISHRRTECTASENITTAEGFCPREFDGWTCVNATPAGTVAQFPCPYFVFGFDPKRTAQRTCLEDGSWFMHPESNKTWSNYTTCVDVEDLIMRTQVNFIYKTGYTVSLAALVISLFIFFYFRSLTCTRIQIHKNLFLSLAINNLLWLVWYEAVVDNTAVLLSNEIWCQALHILVQYFMVATYFWVFCEGVYLHTVLVITFLTESKVMMGLYLIGWGFPALLIIIYAIVRATNFEDTFHCWIHEASSSLVYSVPVGISFIVNFVFLINIVRVLLTKLHSAQQTTPASSFKEKNASIRSKRSTVSGGPAALSKKTRKAVRATLILIPLLGIQFVVVPFRPAPGTPWEYAYQFTLALLASCQGLCVSLLFCFCNGEVVTAVKKKWRQCRLSKKRPWNSCSGVTSVSFSRSSFVQEMAGAVFPPPHIDGLGTGNCQL